MAKEIVLYNLRDDVKEEDYIKWCESFKGPLLLGLSASKSFTLVKMMGGLTGNGQEGTPPASTSSPYRFIGILDAVSQEEWDRSRNSKAFKEDFFPQWFSKWAKDFYLLGGEEVYYGESK